MLPDHQGDITLAELENEKTYRSYLDPIFKGGNYLDNWEWCGGYNARYGLVHVDFQSQRRIWKDSAYWYQKFIADSRK